MCLIAYRKDDNQIYDSRSIMLVALSFEFIGCKSRDLMTSLPVYNNLGTNPGYVRELLLEFDHGCLVIAFELLAVTKGNLAFFKTYKIECICII